MIWKLILAGILILTATSSYAADIVTRAESTELRLTNGKVTPRVERDTDGKVTRLRLDGMRLTNEDAEQLGQLEHLRSLVVYDTPFSDRDLTQLERCESLEHLNLTKTEGTDDAIDSILKLKRLKSLCLGNVNITPGAIERLKEINQTRDRTRDYLRWGYSQRNKDPK